jgi:hypothetical protein
MKRTSKSATTSVRSLAICMSRSLGNRAAVQDVTPMVVKEPTRSSDSLWGNNMAVPLLVLVLIFQIWIMVELCGVKSTMRQLQNGIVNGEGQCTVG